MNLEELSREYCASGTACRVRAEERRRELHAARLNENGGHALRVRIMHLEDMAAATCSTAHFLTRYYDRTRS